MVLVKAEAEFFGQKDNLNYILAFTDWLHLQQVSSLF